MLELIELTDAELDTVAAAGNIINNASNEGGQVGDVNAGGIVEIDPIIINL